eukprot:2895359-Amphidinium_carterae.1
MPRFPHLNREGNTMNRNMKKYRRACVGCLSFGCCCPIIASHVFARLRFSDVARNCHAIRALSTRLT